MLKTIAIVLVVLITLGVGSALGLMQMGGPEGLRERFTPQVEAARVIVEPARRSDLRRTINAPGAIEPKQMVQISAEVSARIVALPFVEGDSVREGDVICRLDAIDLQARLDAAESRVRSQKSQLDGARAELELAQLELGRLQELLDTKDIAKTEFDAANTRALQARSSVAVIEAGIEAAEADVRAARRDLENAVIASPIDGRIVNLPVEVGETVLGTFNNQGSLIMEIADLGTMLMQARIDETSVGLVQEGQTADVRLLAYGDRVFEGVVERVGLQRRVFSDGTSYVQAEVLVEQGEGDLLRTGLTANADIYVDTVRDAIVVPSQAVLDRRVENLPDSVRGSPLVDRQRTFTTVVYVLEDGFARARPVKTGVSDLTDTVILEGLDVDDAVITGPFRVLRELEDGKAVTEDDVDGEDAEAAADDQTPDEGAGDAQTTPG
ncbi:MAG: efflux RND transporter periplasmic adaptor subunit [Phycisphaerales bacterium]|jgi:HlyD family secretion protein